MGVTGPRRTRLKRSDCNIYGLYALCAPVCYKQLGAGLRFELTTFFYRFTYGYTGSFIWKLREKSAY